MNFSCRLLLFKVTSAIFVLVIFILPFFSFPGYSLLSNTPSDLGAHSSPNAWIMNSSLAIFGTGVIIGGWPRYRGFAFQRIILLLLGLSLIMLAFYNHTPLTGNPDQYITEDGWHTYFLCTALLSYMILSITTGFTIYDEKKRWLAISAGLLSFILSIASIKNAGLAGIWQRLNILTVIGWLLYNFRKNELITWPY